MAVCSVRCGIDPTTAGGREPRLSACLTDGSVTMTMTETRPETAVRRLSPAAPTPPASPGRAGRRGSPPPTTSGRPPVRGVVGCSFLIGGAGDRRAAGPRAGRPRRRPDPRSSAVRRPAVTSLTGWPHLPGRVAPAAGPGHRRRAPAGGCPQHRLPPRRGRLFWVWLAGAGLLIGAYAANGGPGGGDSDGVDLFLLALGILVVALLLGCDLRRRPPCSPCGPRAWASSGCPSSPGRRWSSGTMLLLTLPALLADLIAALRRPPLRPGRGRATAGHGIAADLGWTMAAPGVPYALPALGIVADVVPVFARARQPMASAVLVAIGLGRVRVARAPSPRWPCTPTWRTRPPSWRMSLAAVLPVLVVLALGGLALEAGKPGWGSPWCRRSVTGLLLLRRRGGRRPRRHPRPRDLAATAWTTASSTWWCCGGAARRPRRPRLLGPQALGPPAARPVPAKGLAALGLLGARARRRARC